MPRDTHLDFLRFAAVCGLAGAILFTVAWVVTTIFEDGYDALRQDISDLGALTASHPLPYNIALSLSGALLAVFGIGMLVALGRGLTARLGAFAVIVYGAGDFLDGLLREDCSPSGSAICREALDAGQLSWHHEAHDIESAFTIAAMILAPLLLAFAFRQRDGWRDLFAWSLATAAIAFIAIAWYAVLYVTQDGSAYSGLLQRTLIAASTAWVVLVSWRLYATAGSEAQERGGANGG
ncbi:MAG: DUF998 domain-containing protein [Dehalococcoidia bacterium]